MSENQNPVPGSPADPAEPAAETAPLDPPAATAAPAAPLPAAGPVPTKVRWRERAFNLRAVLAVALAGLIVGAGAGVGTTLLATGGHDDGPGRHWMDRRPGPGGGFPGPGGGPGFQQQAPQQDAPQQEQPSQGSSS